jgi:hypothetical protein
MLLHAWCLAVAPLAAQATWTLAETERWVESVCSAMASGSTDETATANLRRITYKSSATIALHDCRLTIIVSDNSGVSGTRTTMQVPLKDVDTGGVRRVSRPEGYHDFIYIPGQYFVTIPARAPDTYPFLTISSRGELKSYLATIPAKDGAAGVMITSAVQRAAELCGAPAAP